MAHKNDIFLGALGSEEMPIVRGVHDVLDTVL